MNDLEIKAEILPLRKIFDNDTFYQIPDYQRPYAWTKDHVTTLLDDIVYAYCNNKQNAGASYFCGSLVCVKNEGKLDVIDGQQRLTTFIILNCVFRDFYKECLEKDKQVWDLITMTISNRYDNQKHRLKLLTHKEYQNNFEQTVLKEIEIKENRGNQSIENAYKNNRYLQNAHYLKEEIQSVLSDGRLTEDTIDDFVKWMFYHVVLTSITCPNTDSAIQIFQILNDRGMPLSPVDIIKADLMRNLEGDNKKSFKADWDYFTKRLEEEDLDISNFFGTYRLYRLPKNPQEALHKALIHDFKKGEKGIDISSAKALEIVYEIKGFATRYIEARNNENNNTYISCLKYLKHDIYWSTIVTTAFHVGYQDGEKLIKVLVAYYYQNWIAGATVARIKNTSFNILSLVKNKKPIQEVIQKINANLSQHGTTKTFEQALTSDSAFHQSWCKPLLLVVEYFSKDTSSYQELKDVTIEHVLPKTPDASWSFTQEQREEWTDALGNLVLLTKRKNVQASNSSFEKKKEVYGKQDGVATGWELARQVLAEEKWDVQTLENRQKSMINKIKGILSIPEE